MTAWFRCACPRCAGRDPDACPCPECQPGPGIDHLAGHNRLSVLRRARMTELLDRLDETLTTDERDELDHLVSIYLHISS